MISEPLEHVHVYPRGDSREHVTDGGPCWCNPIGQTVYARCGEGMPIGVIMIHKAADGREQMYEYGFLHSAN